MQLAGFERLSPESRYFRFFTPMPRMPTSVLDRLLRTDGIDHVVVNGTLVVDAGEHTGAAPGRGIRLGVD